MPRQLVAYNPPLDPYLDIIHKDDALLVINKPSGLLSVPGKYERLFDSVQSRAQKLHPEARIIHRLDMETSGVLLLARSHEALKAVGLQFEQRKTNKTYIAVVSGHIENDYGIIEQPLICDWPNRPLQKIDHEKGKQAVTHYSVIDRYETSTRVELKPITGRSHQLRVHMQHLGHAILGDQLYGTSDVIKSADRLMLHASDISLAHPLSGEVVTYSQIPDF